MSMSIIALSGHRALSGLSGDFLRCVQYSRTPQGALRCVTMAQTHGDPTPDADAREAAGIVGRYRYSTKKVVTRGRAVKAPGIDRYPRVFPSDDVRRVKPGKNVPVPGRGGGHAEGRAVAGLSGTKQRFLVLFTPKGSQHTAKIEVFAENKAKALTEAMKRLKGRFSKILKVT